ncbi:hypothetical protein KAFR_0A05130 [Kazachstania africana CBS 2517]|uniref:Palmitoyltransferase PFA4 n=1 Tax=Kazachstania africana (strain ATCC 22294 / BCRC 22015 / CBS 2517 / CECT 1963 / NBRC 1671 / NRRL Y-8276) TaxID=1071382 RepID=H2ANJ8_KAZAF|nr:hypothetical protein KAFR_0A05130 [Kazachstania africana CBS 2517]CCF55948.1 hypothetical protein KAFR_0A05130 [Kazachstania africana CBS 2517]
MAIQLKWPWLGIAIPTFLISFIGYSAHYFILLDHLSWKLQLWFQFSLSMIWLSYYLAIKADPGSPSIADKNEDIKTIRTYCKKCDAYKPPRAHHCKTCNKCILMMDHHCPWTMNCVGFKNYPHFLRFLFWVIVTTAFLLAQLFRRIGFIWTNWYSSSALVQRQEIVMLTILTPMDAFILLTITLLLIRCTMNQIFSGMSQIEKWEMERLESSFYSRKEKSRDFLMILINNVFTIFSIESPEDYQEEVNGLLRQHDKRRLAFHSIINFPYDIDILTNATCVLGPFFSWLNPFGAPEGDGMHFELNEIASEKASTLADLLLSLPWPPDTCTSKYGKSIDEGTKYVETHIEGGECVLRNRTVSPSFDLPTANENQLSRKSWTNEWGENLQAFGVDIEGE